MKKVLKIEYNDKIRIKITDKCNLACPFCHCEGTRRSNDVDFENKHFRFWLKELRKVFSRVHLTGGDPTLYARLPELCAFLRKLDYEIYLTTNLLLLEENLLRALPLISKISISFHSLNSDYFQRFSVAPKCAEAQLDRIKANILKLKKTIDIAINTVVSKSKDQDLDGIVVFCKQHELTLKLVPDWRAIADARAKIFALLNKYNYQEISQIRKLPGSNYRKIYENNGHSIELKDIRPYYLDFWCNDCKKRKKCIESFAFLRLEGDPLRFKICIDKPSLDSDEFGKKYWQKLLGLYKNPIIS